jgi:uncharacterized protein (TIGR02453 family)
MSAGCSGFTEASFGFFEGLAENNNAAWFHAHRDTFSMRLEAPFRTVLEEVSVRVQNGPLPLRGGAATMFRLNRDIRFSPDKRPYRSELSGLLTTDGTKAAEDYAVYVRIDAYGGFVAGGFWQPTASRLEPIRRRMIEDEAGFADVLDGLSGNGLVLDDSEAVKTMPRGFGEHADHPHAPYLRLKALTAKQQLPKSAWLDDSVTQRVAEHVAN